MSDITGDHWITYNGEIYNYVELKATLQGKGHRFRSDSDTEVILHAYREWGPECLQQLNGMFAFAIWEPHHRHLFCARDRLGIKPFYYYIKNGRFFFASEQKAILAALDSTPSPNLQAVADYLSFSYIPSNETMFQDIRKLDPGTCLNFNKSGISLHTYWDPVFDPTPARKEQEWVDELRALLEDSIRMQIRSDVPIGAHLSGGIDSSAVCCLAAKHVPSLLTFTAKFSEGGFFDETPYARLVAGHIHSDYREIVPKSAHLTELLPKIIYHLDEPIEAASVFGKYHVAETVSQSVKVVLGGQGGDELFGGYDWYIKDLFTALSFGSPQPFTGRSRLGFILDTLKKESTKRLAKSLWKNFGNAHLNQIFCNNWSRFSDTQLTRLFRPEVLSNSELSTRKRFLEAFDKLPENQAIDQMFKFDLRHYLQALLTSEDRLSMAFSVESRVPLLDHRIAELAGRIGAERKTVPGRSKYLLRQALEGIVPAEILNRRDKRGFPTPIGQWLRDPGLNLMENLVFKSNSFAERYFDLTYLKRMEQARTYGSSDATERLWRVLNVCVWGEVFNLS
jgi:asparagine synthase (glutamine-hydrolysing)